MPFDISRFFSLPLCSFQQSCIACVGKMKRTAMDAQLPEEPSRIRLDITMPQEQWGHWMTFQVLCKSDETVDDAKKRLHSMIWEARGWSPKVSSFRFLQNGEHIPYTRPVTDLNPLFPVICVRST